MGSCADSNSDPEEDFPVYGFLQPGRWPSRPRTEKADPVVLDGCDADEPRPCFPPATADPVAPGSGGGAPDVIMLGSDSEEDDAPYTPLALRLKRRHGPAVSTSGSAAHALQGPLCCAPGPEPSPPGALNVTEETAIPRSWPPPKRKPPCVPTEEIQPHKKQRAARERQHKGVDKEAHRLELEKQKAERKALAEAAKALRPEECIKHVVAVVDPALLQLEGGGALLTTVQALGCSCAIEKQPLPRSVGWVRRVPGLQPGELASVPEAHVVMQVTVDDLITLIHNHTQELKHGRTEQRPTLTSWVRDLQVCNPDRDLNLVVVDLEKYFRSQKSQSQKTLRGMVLGEEQVTAKRRKKPGAEASPQVSRVEVEEAVVHLQLHAGVPVTFLPTWKSFLDHIAMTTKAVAEAPFKREREKTGFSFYLESEWAGGQRVDRAGKGLLQVWKRQIQQLNRVSPDMASAILAAYPSPQLLRQAYRRCRTDGERLSLLSELLIRRGEGVTSTTRRVGPELAKRLLHLMTSSDPQQNLDSTA